MSITTFNLKKNIQVISYLLSKNNNQLNYTKLLKLLYLADRKSLEEYNYAITGDEYFSLQYGPVLSRISDLIKDNPYISLEDKNEWNRFFVVKDYDLFINNKITPYLQEFLADDNMELSDAEIEILDKIDEEYKGKPYTGVIDIVHDEKLYPEIQWQEAKKYQTSLPLPIEDILKKLGRSESEIEYIKHQHEEEQTLALFLKEKGC